LVGELPSGASRRRHDRARARFRERPLSVDHRVMTTALIIGDVQRGITSTYPFARQVVPPLLDLIPRARAAGILVVFVRIAFRTNRADLPPGNALIASFFDAGDMFHEGATGTALDLSRPRPRRRVVRRLAIASDQRT
jgi:nicotinamidase-related amidase